MDRTDSRLSQSSILSEGTFNDVLNSVGPGYIEQILGENAFFDAPSETPLILAETVTPATSQLPSREEYDGPYNFSVQLNADPSSKNGWLYSNDLKKVFVGMLSKVSFQFKWMQKEAGLYVRALLVYCSEDHFERPVLRCPCHSSPLEASNIGFSYVDHVIRSDHDWAVYHKNPVSGRVSVIVPLDAPHPGTDWVTIVYTFVCKNSCSAGMNRRSTAIIFTLERSNGEVIGRKVMGLRVCSCPKRDKEKEERGHLHDSHQDRRQHPLPVSMPQQVDGALVEDTSEYVMIRLPARKEILKPVLMHGINEIRYRAAFQGVPLSEEDKEMIEDWKRIMDMQHFTVKPKKPRNA